MTPATDSVHVTSNRNHLILAQMKALACEMKTLATELEQLPKIGVWNTIQTLSAGIQEMLESGPAQRLR
jgi:hypothetical protein